MQSFRQLGFRGRFLLLAVIGLVIVAGNALRATSKHHKEHAEAAFPAEPADKSGPAKGATVKPGDDGDAKSADGAGVRVKTDSAASTPDKPDQSNIGDKQANLSGSDKDFETFLDRLMMAESGGRLDAKNPRSSALGPYQFISSTFLSVARRYFADEVKDLSSAKILRLRTDKTFARRAAAAYTREIAAHLAAEGLQTTYGNLRLAYLLGPSGAEAILKAKPKMRVASLLGPGVVRANPFLAGYTAEDLIARCSREISIDPSRVLATTGRPKARQRPRIRVRCNLSRPSCRRWLALKKRKLRASSRRRQARISARTK